jgi:glycosyltransferase involved in cell wall biosynthesis
MPVYNGERYLLRALDSLLSQTYSDFELVIADNASTDGTEDIVREYAARDARIRYIRNRENYGVVWNLNNVFCLTRGSYFKWAACDDEHEPQFLKRCVEALDADPTAVLACSRVSAIDDLGRTIPTVPEPQPRSIPGSPSSADPVERWQFLMRYERSVHTVAPDSYSLWWPARFFGVIRARALEQTGLHRMHKMGDHMLLAELALTGRFVELPDELLHIRFHSEQASRRVRGERMAGMLPGLAHNRLRLLAALLWAYPQRVIGDATSIWRARLTPRQRLACYYELAAAASRLGIEQGDALVDRAARRLTRKEAFLR